MNFLRRIFRPNARTRRILAGLCAAFLLAVIFASSVFVAQEADHDCTGHDCPICLELQNCIDNFQLLGSSVGGASSVVAPRAAAAGDIRFVCAYRAPSLTLQRLDVRFDE